jgi:hypothetical protein
LSISIEAKSHHRLGTTEPPQVGERRVVIKRRFHGEYVFIAYHVPEANT